MKFARKMAIGIAVLTIGACYPDFKIIDDGTTGATTGGSGGGDSSTTASAGGDGGATPSSTMSTGGAGSGGGAGGGGSAPCVVMHPGGGTCEYLPGKECGCPANEKCSVDDPKTGHTKCIPYAQMTGYTKCTDDGDCGAGSWCDIWTEGVCHPICANVGDCAALGLGPCIAASSDPANITPIPGLKVCMAHCDPEGATPCGPGVTCVYDSPNADLDCATSGNVSAGGLCLYINDCAKGLVCESGFPTGICKKWCHPVGTDPLKCPAMTPHCKSVAYSIDYEGSTYGVCSP